MGSFSETEIDPKPLYRKFLLNGCLKRPHLRIFEIDKLQSGGKLTLQAEPSFVLLLIYEKKGRLCLNLFKPL